ncbi:hypothetical protein M422DRAFT_252118 [Sphaerobolus stellatus SS14]|uniref:DUF6535 domain-containing protein n=1 Tax=Sphaerobolus stellatus (strain SS14) TaxID=990650 RepID=A0A0C9W0S9_SPHS4|nr:hypothetical protein M422DRAFT_252118 [Sphaerobolus stellatus SS14]
MKSLHVHQRPPLFQTFLDKITQSHDLLVQVWVAYEKIARQSDEEFLKRYNGDLDVQLIFVGLFSAVSSAFIIDLKSELQPNPSELTNALLTLLMEAGFNRILTDQSLVLP